MGLSTGLHFFVFLRIELLKRSAAPERNRCTNSSTRVLVPVCRQGVFAKLKKQNKKTKALQQQQTGRQSHQSQHASPKRWSSYRILARSAAENKKVTGIYMLGGGAIFTTPYFS